jgi:hypothetical protein
VIRNEVFVARGSFKEPVPDFEPDVERIMQERLRKSPALAAMPKDFVRKEVQKEVKGSLERVPPGYMRQWTIDLGRTAASLRDQPLFLRVKFFAVDASPSGTYLGLWEAGPEQSPNRWQNIRSQAAETFHEFPIASNLFDSKGMLSVRFINQNETTLMFPLEDGFEVLYRAGGFGANYTRGIAIVFCWLGLLAAVGLAAASFLSFPVAAFFSVAVLILAFSTNTMVQVIEQGTIRAVDNETGQVAEANLFDHATVGFFKGMLATVKLVRDFSPIDSLSTGRKISWGQLSRAFGQVILLAGGLFMAIGIATFTRRELATAQGKT